MIDRFVLQTDIISDTISLITAVTAYQLLFTQFSPTFGTTFVKYDEHNQLGLRMMCGDVHTWLVFYTQKLLIICRALVAKTRLLQKSVTLICLGAFRKVFHFYGAGGDGREENQDSEG